ncbi:MAG: MBOAT family protein [Flavobacteriales bacterium]|jgi:D-alanyl-lipoteichoic acid acyltransferase DltB (MBOAT superfamily)|nr:MBOAT family protein [Flavobacteriales bacterium]MCB0757629.1 MBOAT family protein [Flavobacteriales bacterium]
MIFNSIPFLIFFVVVVVAYYVLPHRWRWPLLLTASCYFYMAFVPAYILILAFTIGVDYFGGIFIERSKGAARKRWLTASVLSNVSVLAFFKYYAFLTENIEALMQGIGWLDHPLPELGIILPIGLSFHTFQSLSYTIEVYYGRQKAERHFGIFSLYVMFFPQLVAGPIERPGNLLRQLHLKIQFNAATVASGLRLMAWGFFKKLIIADRVAVMVDHVYNAPGDHEGPALILATFFFAIQIYCDFSGYTDIALGAARCLGISLMRNFRTPYYSANVSEFWSRWHISLSTWFRDYVYIPMGGNRVVKWRWYFNLMVTFVLSGFWHGAAWTYIIWGMLHGFFLIFAIVSKDVRSGLGRWLGLEKVPRLNHVLQVLITFILVDFAWIFFRASSVHDAFQIVGNLFTGLGGFFTRDAFTFWSPLLGVGRKEMALALLGIAVMELVQRIDLRRGATQWISARPPWQRWAFYTGLVCSVIYFGSYYNPTQFIYFQF